MKNCAGFTIIEMICAIVIMGIMGAYFTGYLRSESQLFSLVYHNRDVNQNARVILNRMAREIRQADTMTVTSPSDITFTSDIDDNGTDETVRYYLSGTDLHKVVGAADQLILDNVSSFVCQLNYGGTVFTVQSFGVASGEVAKTFSTSFSCMRRFLLRRVRV